MWKLHPESPRIEQAILSQAPPLPGLPRLAHKLLPLAEVQSLYDRLRNSSNGFQLEDLLRELNITLRFEANHLTRIPAQGPAIVVANHPFGILDGAILGVLLARVRPNVKVMTNSLLAGVPELHDH